MGDSAATGDVHKLSSELTEITEEDRRVFREVGAIVGVDQGLADAMLTELDEAGYGIILKADYYNLFARIQELTT